jgi:hypothetical protein
VTGPAAAADVGPTSEGPRHAPGAVTGMAVALAALSVLSALTGLLNGGGAGTREVVTTRGVEVTVYGKGLYAWDTWLVGAGNRGQDLVVLLVEVPLLLVGLLRWRRGAPLSGAALVGVLAFFGYYWVSMTFATAQNALFPVYVACLGLSTFLMVATVRGLDVRRTAAQVPARPGRRVLAGYLVAVAGALTVAWLPGMVATAVGGEVAEAVGPYTSAVTEALDLAVVVPVAVLAAVLVLRGTATGSVLALVMLVLNVCIGVLLMGQGAAQLVAGVPLTPAEIVAKMATFAALTLVAGGLLLRMAATARGQRSLRGTSWARS